MRERTLTRSRFGRAVSVPRVNQPRELHVIAIVRRAVATWLFCALLSAQLDTRWFGALRSSEAAPLPSTSTTLSSPSLGPTRTISIQSVSAAALPGSAPILAELSRYEYTEPHMGTTVRLVFYAKDEAEAVSAARAGFERVAALNRILSDYDPTSELMRLCAHAGQGPIAISDDLYRVLDAALSLATRSHGAFDITAGPLTRLWRSARHLSELPDPARIEEARARSGFSRLHLNPLARTATLADKGMTLDVGGIAKGYTADSVLTVLENAGITRALVALGGDIAVSEPPPGLDAWTVNVASLDIPGAPRIAPLHLRHAAVSTAGDAEQWMTANGHRYSHILDPRTGWPMSIRSSTTVIAPRGLDADGLDTTAAILGPSDGLALVEGTPGAAMFMVREESDGHITVHRSTRWPSSPTPWPAVNAASDSKPTDTKP